MKKNPVLTALALVIFIIMGLISCEKEGLGGKGEIKGYAYHENKIIKSAIFYIKYGANSSPGTDISQYDASSVSDSNGKFHFKELNKGDYYIYAVGTDDDQTIVGGVHVELEKNESKDNIQINIAP